ncbi:hypothetical protein JTE88_02415 [Arcanobacterium phocisimile]|uniref:Lipoprotein LpqN n=1 Tax=Arcanobacterium phocisimile TaxID=1302235 RepID=A0ABX7IJB2_9ACTO|nr:hypothetical protein [Arcanobacterium phocisimile]QRV02619.1 hypothetical protein JTE88_02415 [Arcanobacterium phocisimile]
MSRKYLSVILAVGLLVSGCSQGDTAEESAQQSDQSSIEATQDPSGAETLPTEPETSLSDVTLRRAIKETDLVDRAEGAELISESPTLRIQLPARFTRQSSTSSGHIGIWQDGENGNKVVLSIAGIAGIASDADKYAEYLSQAVAPSGRTIEYFDTVFFGEISAYQFSVTGGAQSAEIYAFELDGIAYELTVNALDDAALDELRPHILQTFGLSKAAESSADNQVDTAE